MYHEPGEDATIYHVTNDKTLTNNLYIGPLVELIIM
jgi:hypothetical protein